MLTHHNTQAEAPGRVIIIGARGFLGSSTKTHLDNEGVDTVGVTSNDIDLTETFAATKLAEIVQPNDAVVMFAALTPDRGKGIDTMMKNFVIADTVCSGASGAALCPCRLYQLRCGLPDGRWSGE